MNTRHRTLPALANVPQYLRTITMIMLTVVLALEFASCENGTTNAGGTSPANSRKLSAIRLVEQPADSQLCAVANIKMVEEYYFGSSNGWDYIFDQVSSISSQGRRNSANYLVGNYLEKRDLYSSIVRFSDLAKILNYLEENQIPAIMSIQVVGNPLLGHSVLFAGYDSATGYVTIKDPENRNRTSIHYNDLENSFIKVSDAAEIGGNIMVIASDKFISVMKAPCGICGKLFVYDAAIREAIQYVFCNVCDRGFSVR